MSKSNALSGAQRTLLGEVASSLTAAATALGALLGGDAAPAPTARRARTTRSSAAKTTKPAKKAAKKGPKAQPAPTPDFIVQRAVNHQGNVELAAWMREHGIVPQGQAWAAAKAGDRGVRALKALNAADGIALLPTAAAKGTATQVAAKVPSTTKAKGRTRNSQGRFVAASQEDREDNAAEMRLRNALSGTGLTDAEIDRVVAAKLG